MFEKLTEMISELLGVDASTITESSSFKDDLGADSLDLMELIMNLEEEFQTTIPTEDLEKIITVGDAMKYIQQNQ